MRRAKACAACRQRRRRCDTPGPGPGQPCTFCVAKGLPCSRSELEIGTISSYTPDPREDCPFSRSLCAELIQFYFDYVHDQFHTLFHPPSFVEDVNRGQAPRILVYGMMALSARFSQDPCFSAVDPRQRGRGYAEECRRLLDWTDVSFTTIQACVLLGAIAITDGDPAAENIYYTIACRMAQLMDLPNCPTDSPLEKEINIRLWWALNMIDVWSSAGVRLPRLLTPKPNVPLPIDEIVFRRMTREMTRDQIPEPETRSSLLAEMVRLNRILLQINDFNMRASTEELDLDTILGHVQDLSDQLDVWLRELPDHIRDTRANMERYAAQGLGRVFAAIYLGYYHYGQMLFYRFLHEDSQSSSTRTRHYAGKCKDHARGLCNIVYASEEVPGCDVRYNMVGHVLVIASTVQIHSLLFEADEQQVALARSRLEKNYVFLIRLQSLWPTLEFCMDRLMAFHEACKNSADTTFYMDRWMVRFLVEFASPVGDRDSCAKDRSPWSLELLIHPNEVTYGS